ncbi:hypothetical protein BH20ACT8_BH20ACT8_09750 [soil metagenome]
MLAEHVPELIGLGTLHRILGEKRVYTLEDAQSVHKRQYTAARYREAMDAIRLRQLVTNWLQAQDDPSQAADQGV